MKNTTILDYAFVAEMPADEAIGLYYFLIRWHRDYPHSFMTETWDVGIGECKDRLTSLGYRFRSLRAGHHPMVESPDGQTREG